LAKPSFEEYWHIGEIAIRFLNVTDLMVNGDKSFDMVKGNPKYIAFCLKKTPLQVNLKKVKQGFSSQHDKSM
jgi:hypothetical protein